jgi:hypothetical protein
MDKKLTLSLNQKIIEKAKAYAKHNKTSLSKMIETYFQSLTQEIGNEEDVEITPLIESLSGVGELSKDFDYKKSRSNYLKEKHK